MAVGDIYQSQVYYNIGSEISMNVTHWKEKVVCTDPIPAQSVGLMVHNIWHTHYINTLFSVDSHVTLITTRRIKPTAGVPSILVVGGVLAPAIAGLGVGDPLPSTSALLLSLYTNLFDANGRGRLYIPGAASGVQNDGQLIAAALLDFEAWQAEFYSDQVAVGGGTGEWRCVVYSRALGTGQEVTQAVAHTNLATQRGRRNFPGLGT